MDASNMSKQPQIVEQLHAFREIENVSLSIGFRPPRADTVEVMHVVVSVSDPVKTTALNWV